MQDPERDLAVGRALSILESTLPMLELAGFHSLVYDDFYETFATIIENIVKPDKDDRLLTDRSLLDLFQTPEGIVPTDVLVDWSAIHTCHSIQFYSCVFKIAYGEALEKPHIHIALFLMGMICSRRKYDWLLTTLKLCYSIQKRRNNWTRVNSVKGLWRLAEKKLVSSFTLIQISRDHSHTCRTLDHVQMIALCRALQLNIDVAYLDGRRPDGIVDFIPIRSADENIKPLVLLYRYVILIWCACCFPKFDAISKPWTL